MTRGNLKLTNAPHLSWTTHPDSLCLHPSIDFHSSLTPCIATHLICLHTPLLSLADWIWFVVDQMPTRYSFLSPLAKLRYAR